MATDLSKSSSNLNEVVYAGRPKNEEPHVKKSVKRKSEKIEYILRVDLDELKIGDEEFENFQSLFQLFDHDKDGILSFKEFEKLLKCIGHRVSEQQAQEMAMSCSIDKTNYSMSFNEFLKFMSLQKDVEPDSEMLLDIFASFDKENYGKISEKSFKNIMMVKDNVTEKDVEEMLEEYYRYARANNISTDPPEDYVEDQQTHPKNRKGSVISKSHVRWIDYKEFCNLLQS